MAAENREAIEALQLDLLRRLLGTVRVSSAFYRESLEQAGLDEDVASLEEFVVRMPLTTKGDLARDREAHPPYGSNLVYPLEKYSRFSQSSGTTRDPLAFLDTHDSWSAMLDCWDRIYDAAGVGADDAIFFAFSFGPFLGFWTAYEAATRRGNLAIPGGGMGSEARLDALRRYGASVLCCTPTYALRLGEVLRGQGDAGRKNLAVRRIIVAGEAGGSIPETRRKIEELWPGARVFDHHGMTEVGPVTYEHPREAMTLCVMEEAYFAEVIDPETEKEVAAGERGELVLTTLTRTAAPLLRYRTGDFVCKSYSREDTTDGVARDVLAFAGGILGRVDEMVVVRGVNIYPSAVEDVLRGFEDVLEYQVVESTRDAMAELEIIIEPVEGVPDPGALAERVAKASHKAFSLRIPVRAAAPGSLPRFEFKSQRWVKE